MTIPSLDIAGGRATIRLNRPDKRNRIEPADLVALADHLDAIDADPAGRGAGDRGQRAVVV